MKKKILFGILCLNLLSIVGCSTTKETLETTETTETTETLETTETETLQDGATTVVGGSAIVILNPDGTSLAVKDNSYGTINIENNKENDKITNETEEEIIEKTETLEENVEENKKCYIYTANYDATGFDIREVEYNDENILDVIINNLKKDKNLPENVIVNNFSIEENQIYLDLNEEYLTFISSQGTTGEYYSIGSVVNSFLENYKEIECINLTINGEHFSTGHAEYFGPFKKFE